MQPSDENLLNRFKSIPENDLDKVISKGLKPEAFEDATRFNAHKLNESWTDFKSFLHTVLKWSIVTLAFLFFVILIRYLIDVITSEQETKLLLKEIWNAVLISGATLFIQHAVSKKQ
jgi:hypothetical protein